MVRAVPALIILAMSAMSFYVPMDPRAPLIAALLIATTVAVTAPVALVPSTGRVDLASVEATAG